MTKVTIIDGYIDEPTCLGVPPYISPYPRYLAGSIWDFDKKNTIQYLTIDQIRNQPKHLETISKTDLLVVIAGMSVPGRYLSGYPASPNEITRILQQTKKPLKVLTGPAARHGFGTGGGQKTQNIDEYFDIVIKGDGEIVINDLLKNNLKLEKIDPTCCRKNANSIKNFAKKGADIVKQHPNYPDYLITEIETYRGCPRTIVGGCSFCSEPNKGLPDFRPINDIVEEIQNLYNNGIRHFRMGNQPCIFSYMASEAGTREFPKPNPDAVEQLFSGIRWVAPGLKTLHIDNANPGILARYPKESTSIAKTIIKYHTPGDIAAFGVESVDPTVIKENNLKADKDEVTSAIRLLNKVGKTRGENGMPHLLPGLNFVFGLRGETKKTFQQDYNFLKNILDDDLLLRRINLRQVIPIPGTKMYETGFKNINRHKREFQHFKNMVNENILRPMLKKILPPSIVLTSVYTEKQVGKLTFARQIGTYPILIGIPGRLGLRQWIDVKVIDYGYRSITALPYPVNINTAGRETLEAIPSVGKKRTIRIMRNRPFKNVKEIKEILDEPELASKILEYVTFK